MKKMRFLVTLLIMSILLPNISASAMEITPYNNNTSSTITSFDISSSGKATIRVSYNGYTGVTSGATIKTYIEKKVLFFWIRVNIGQSNNEWTDIANGAYFSTSHSVQLSDKGEYRSVVTYTVRGSGGESDIIPSTIYRTY